MRRVIQVKRTVHSIRPGMATKFGGKIYRSGNQIQKDLDDRMIIVDGLQKEIQLVTVRKIFPEMVKEMRELMDQMHNGQNTKPGFFRKTGSDSVYSSFQYSKAGQAKQSNAALVFKNHSTHINALTEGVEVARYTDVGGWVKSMARMGKLQSKRIHKRTGKGRWPGSPRNHPGKTKGWPEVISGVGATKYAVLASTLQAQKKYKKQQDKARKGSKKYTQATRHLNAANRRAQREVSGKKFSALVKNKSERNFWTPIIKKYWGRLPTLPPASEVRTKAAISSSSVAVKTFTDSMYYRMLKNAKKIKRRH